MTGQRFVEEIRQDLNELTELVDLAGICFENTAVLLLGLKKASRILSILYSMAESGGCGETSSPCRRSGGVRIFLQSFSAIVCSRWICRFTDLGLLR